MAIEDRLDRLTDVLEQFIDRQPGGSGMGVRPKKDMSQGLDDPAVRENLRKNVREYTKGLKDATSPLKSLTNVFEGVREELDFSQTKDNFNLLDQALLKTSNTVEIAAIEEQKRELLKASALKTGVTAAANFAGGMLKAASMILDASRQFELSIQSGASGVEAGTQNLIASIQANKQIQDTQADLIKDASQGIGMLGMAFGKWGKIIGGIVTLLGPLVSSFMKFNNEQEAKAKEHQAKLYGEELKKTQEVYKQTTEAGAFFAGGMTEMRDQAVNAGMRLKDFGDAIKQNISYFHQMGMTVTDAAIRMGNVRKSIRDSDLDMRFRALGMNSKEQAEAIAMTSAMINNAGQLRTTSDKSVAAQTFQYSKDLKVLQELTGEDAKKKMEEARKETMAADIRARLLAKDPTGESLKRFQQVFATVPAELKKGFLEKVSSGGAAITDVSYNIAAAQNSAIGSYMENVYAATNNTALSASQAQDVATKALTTAGQATLQNSESMSTFAMATRFTADGTLQGANAIFTSFIEAGVNIKAGATETARGIIDSLESTRDPLTNQINRLEKETDAIASSLENRLTPALAGAAAAMPRFTGAIKDAYEALGLITGKEQKGTGEVAGEVGGALAGMAAGAAIGSFIPVLGTVVGGAVGAAIGGYLGDKAGGAVGRQYDNAVRTGGGTDFETTSTGMGMSFFAKGGIARGAESGFPAMLHGIEAVVPLPDGKALPVNLDLSNSSLLASIGKLTADAINNNSTSNTPTSTLAEDTSTIIKQLTDTITTYNRASASDSSSKMLEDMVAMMKTQLDKQEEMIAHLKENVDVNQRLLNQSYA